MKQWQAQPTQLYIQSHYAGRILVAIDDSYAQRDGTGYNIVLLLLPGQRRIISPFVESIKSILLAWEVAFLRPEAPPLTPIVILEEQVVADRLLAENGYACGNPACICHKDHYEQAQRRNATTHAPMAPGGSRLAARLSAL